MIKNILVTGSHRSGTTWTGTVIAKAANIRYVHEPFNIEIIREDSPLNYWFEHLNNSPEEHQTKVKDYICSFFKGTDKHRIDELGNIKSLKGMFRYTRYLLTIFLSNRTVIKDPIAVMSAEWFYNNFNLDIVVLIRHPAAFVASLKIKGWEYDFNNYLNQKSLINSYLKNYEHLIVEYSTNKKDIIDQGILLWNTIHHVINYYQSKYSNEWCFVRHEDLSLNPIVEFEHIFDKIGLNFSLNVKKYINQTTKGNLEPDHLKNSTDDITNVKRNSEQNIKSWKSRLSDDEIQRIKKGTEHVWEKFYTESDW